MPVPRSTTPSFSISELARLEVKENDELAAVAYDAAKKTGLLVKTLASFGGVTAGALGSMNFQSQRGLRVWDSVPCRIQWKVLVIHIKYSIKNGWLEGRFARRRY